MSITIAGDMVKLARSEALDEAAALLREAATKLRGTSKRINQFDSHTVHTLNDFADRILALKEPVEYPSSPTPSPAMGGGWLKMQAKPFGSEVKPRTPPKEEHVCKPSCHNPCLLD